MAIGQLEVYFAYLPYKHQSWSDLYHLTSDKDISVRAQAYHSLGKILIYKAVETEKEEHFIKEREEGKLCSKLT